MRFMVLVKANEDTEAGKVPDEKILVAMAKYNEELVKAGAMLDGGGLQSTSKRAKGLRREPGHRTPPRGREEAHKVEVTVRLR